MSKTTTYTWYEANQSHLMAAVSQVRAALAKLSPPTEAPEAPQADSCVSQAIPESVQWTLSQPPALETVCATFELSPFERKVLLMCAGVELDSRFGSVVASAHKDPRRSQPTFSLALAAFDDAHWSALSPARPLRHWQLVEVLRGDALTGSPLRIDERVLHFLTGVQCVDERLRTLVKPLPMGEQLAASHLAISENVARLWSESLREPLLPIVQLCGEDAAGHRGIAAAACALMGLELHALAARDVPRNATEIDSFLRLWGREAVLSSNALLIECNNMSGTEEYAEGAVAELVESIRTPLLLSTRIPRRCAHRSLIVFDVNKPTPQEQGDIWRSALETAVPGLNGEVARLVSQFNLSSTTIRAAAAQVAGGLRQDAELEKCHFEPGAGIADRLWEACRLQARPRLEGLAQLIEPAATWDDLVLPEKQKQTLGHIAIHVRQRSKVYQEWGFASKGSRGLGISALFAGPSGTGKTMAAEVLAKELRLDLYRIDLSQVVSKYIGETEKNLRRVFDAAEEGASMLLFDEADALFGKRSEVKDSHDRYANIEVSYLLQRMEAYRGLAVLTTNRRSALDPAFLRRIRFVVEFPFPEAAQRAEIWRRVFPSLTPTEGLRIERLARLNAAGGHIRNIAMGAAFLAADGDQPVRMSHLLCAARSEFAKIERPLTDSEIAGWI